MKRESLKVILLIVVMAVCSCAVPDSRSPQFMEKSTIVADCLKKLNSKIETAHYIAYTEEEPIEETCEEYVEEVDNAPAEIEELDIVEEVAQEDSNYSIVNGQGLIFLGTYEITAYEWTGNPCANGNYPTEGYTVACNDLSLGTEVWIEGIGYRVVEDTGGGGPGWMDLYLGDVDACYEWGRQYREVYIYE